jgi:GAF domain-containing protein
MPAEPSDDMLRAEQALRDLATIVLGDSCFEAVLQRATEVTKRAIPGAAEVSVTMRQEGREVTVAASGPLAVAADERQYETGTGPCLDAFAKGEVFIVSDLTIDSRWPEYAARVRPSGITSSLSVPLLVDGISVGAINAYSLEPAAFDDESVQRLAQDLAAYAGIVLNNAGLYFNAATRAEQMAEAMRTRAVIEQAKGILMAARRCTADEAFDLLVRLSQQSHRKLRDIAVALVEQTVEQSRSRVD